jgi:hypothetical protein
LSGKKTKGVNDGQKNLFYSRVVFCFFGYSRAFFYAEITLKIIGMAGLQVFVAVPLYLNICG